MMKEPSAPPGSSPVPAFLMKLWALLEDPSNGDVITWNWNGQNFCILDDQRFSKEILPKYFKHNNLSSFIRQLNMYGFRKVMSLESGLVRSERGSGIEFQHPFFKKGRAELLEHIKRKLSTSIKPDDPPLSQEELQKVATELQELKDVQTNMDTKLENMRRENQALWKEVSSLRRKHSQQQKLLTKILQFIMSLMRGNIMMGPKRKRQLTLEATPSPPTKFSRNVLQFPEDVEKEVRISSQHSANPAESALQIHEIFSPGEGTSEPIKETMEQTQNFTVQPETHITTEIKDGAVLERVIDDSVLQLQSLAEQNLLPGSSEGGEELALDLVQANSSEDDDSVINSILNEHNAANSNDLLYREEIQDFLSCIDASLEELQTMLSRKKLNVDTDFIDEVGEAYLSFDHPEVFLEKEISDNPMTEPNTSITNELQENEDDVLRISDDHLNNDKQLMQYTGNPLLSLFDPHSSEYGMDMVDPATLLTTMGEDAYVDSSAIQHDSVAGCSSSKESGLLGEDLSGPQELLPLFVLSPVNELIDEAKESEELGL